MSAVLPLSQSSRDLIIQVARGLEPKFAQITEEWRNRVTQEFGFDPRTLAALKRMTIATGCSFFCQGDFASFFENVTYFGSRLAKLEVDTRAVSRTLEIYNTLCEPHLEASFGERLPQAQAALQMLSSATFIALSGAYFDSKSSETHALLALSDAELAATDVSTLLHTTLEVVTAKFGATIGALLLKNTESDVLGLEAAVGMDLEDYGLTIPVGQGFSGRIVQSGEPLLALDASLEAQVLSPTLRRDAKTLWGVPVRTTAGVLGALVLGFDKPFYEWLPRERQLLQAMADRAGAGLERARMTEALREREATIARLSGHLLTAQEEERKRISRELHDETGQALMVIRLYLGMLESAVKAHSAKLKIKETVEVVDRTVDGLRRIMGKLSPLVLQELGLLAAVRKEAKDLAKNTGISTRLEIPEDIGRLSPQMETGVYRIVQESLHNVAKHAKAKNVTVQMSLENSDLRLVIEDDGVGMGVAMAQKSASRGQSFGLAGIKERVSIMNGTVRVCSVKGQGTRIEVHVPAAQPALKLVKSASAAEPAPAAMSAAAQGADHA